MSLLEWKPFLKIDLSSVRSVFPTALDHDYKPEILHSEVSVEGSILW